MNTSEQTLQQIDRAIRKIAEKFPAEEEATQMTDIHIRVAQEMGELTVFNDDDEEITRCIVEQWINNGDDDFYEEITPVLRKCIEKNKTIVEGMSILKPFSFVLENDDKESVAELYLVDDELVIIDPDIMSDLDEDLNAFLENLLKE
ncbi:MAG: hypothetical protein J6W56_01045 [Prevotella sp.]|nr:hypothetical protein [Prevotella sp.]